MSRSQEVVRADRGYTLIEVLVVLVIVAVVAVVAIPQVRLTLPDEELRRAGRQVVSLLAAAEKKGALSTVGCAVSVLLPDHRLAVSCPESTGIGNGGQRSRRILASVTLPDGVSIDSVFNAGNERCSRGTCVLWVNRFGQLEPSIINLRYGDSELGIETEPFTSAVRLTDTAMQPASSALVRQ